MLVNTFIIYVLYGTKFFDGFIEKFDKENIDGQHPRPPVLAMLLETIEREIFMYCYLSVKSVNSLPSKNCAIQCVYVCVLQLLY